MNQPRESNFRFWLRMFGLLVLCLLGLAAIGGIVAAVAHLLGGDTVTAFGSAVGTSAWWAVDHVRGQRKQRMGVAIGYYGPAPANVFPLGGKDGKGGPMPRAQR